MFPKKFLIIGCQRSGTTMLRLILESHSEIACRDEPKCYEILSDPALLQNSLEQEQGKKWVGFKIPRFSEQLDNIQIYDFGTPNVPEPFPNFYKNNPIIFIVRDVRDVVCSMRELIADGIPWMKRWGIPVVKYYIENSSEFQKRFHSDISILKKLNFSEFATGAFFWKYKNDAYFRYSKLNFPLIKNRYEDFVKNPRPFLESIMNFLGLEWEDSLLKHHTLEHSETDENRFTIGNTDSNRPISSFHVGRYKEELTNEQIEDIISISGDMMKSFGYKI